MQIEDEAFPICENVDCSSYLVHRVWPGKKNAGKDQRTFKRYIVLSTDSCCKVYYLIYWAHSWFTLFHGKASKNPWMHSSDPDSVLEIMCELGGGETSVQKKKSGDHTRNSRMSEAWWIFPFILLLHLGGNYSSIHPLNPSYWSMNSFYIHTNINHQHLHYYFALI